MKIISGSCRGMPILAPSGQITRPTSARVREAVMSILTPLLEENITFVDLFAGSGAMGIEAMSRGVRRGLFVENDKNALKALKKNLAEMERRLDKQGITWDEAQVIPLPAEKAIQKLSRWPAKMIWADPPYAYCKQWLSTIDADSLNKIAADEAVFCLEAAWDLKDEIVFCGEQSNTWEKIKERRYGETFIGIWKRK